MRLIKSEADGPRAKPLVDKVRCRRRPFAARLFGWADGQQQIAGPIPPDNPHNSDAP